ncbi:hypothetical protein [Brevibacillus laterosporus]|uniref:Uncharacterized protein n=1 Tax=Brevibacillus laterosporus TaxID=1465 RepID=A0AAP8U763_BRELA|nr:hypothetical protein [Brevibacillus laterosporus]PPB12988.1 hypothetical protein C4A77_00965 [Brevibacillus laterosporus]
MFKQVYGFDPDVFKVGQAVKIKDSESMDRKGISCFDPDETEHFKKNISGNYLIFYVEVLHLKLIDSKGEKMNVPIRHLQVKIHE